MGDITLQFNLLDGDSSIGSTCRYVGGMQLWVIYTGTVEMVVVVVDLEV